MGEARRRKQILGERYGNPDENPDEKPESSTDDVKIRCRQRLFGSNHELLISDFYHVEENLTAKHILPLLPGSDECHHHSFIREWYCHFQVRSSGRKRLNYIAFMLYCKLSGEIYMNVVQYGLPDDSRGMRREKRRLLEEGKEILSLHSDQITSIINERYIAHLDSIYTVLAIANDS